MKRSEKLEYISFAEMTVDIKCALSSKLNEWFDPDLVGGWFRIRKISKRRVNNTSCTRLTSPLHSNNNPSANHEGNEEQHL